MKREKASNEGRLWLYFLLCLVSISLLVSDLFAQAETPTSKITIRTGTPTAVPRERLARVARVALFITGQDTWRTLMMQDALTVELTRVGIDVIERTKAERYLAEEIAKRTPPLEGGQSKEGGTTKQGEAPKAPPPSLLPSIAEMAQTLGADSVITGSLVEEIIAIQKNIKRPPEEILETRQRAVTTAASFQILDASNGQLLAAGVVSFEDGATIPQTAQSLAAAIYGVRK